MLRLYASITQEHDLRLVALAACICALACFTTLNLLARAQATGTRSYWAWLAAAAAVFGCGVWSLHFVAMLAFMPDMPVAYDMPSTLGSVFVAAAGAMLAFTMWRLARSRWVGIVLAGTVLGLAVGVMHYSGVAAMRVPGRLNFDRSYVIASITVGIAAAIIALSRSANLHPVRRRIEVSAWLALCVCGTHFIGMTAVAIDAGAMRPDSATVDGRGWLAITVGAVSMAILLIGLAATLMEQYLRRRAVQELKRMRVLSDISHEALVIHRDGTIVEVNAASARLFGFAPTQLIGRSVLELVVESDHASVSQRSQPTAGHVRPEEVQVLTADGEGVVEMSSSTIEYEGRSATALLLRDLSERRRDEARIRHLAHHDALTGLANRFLLQERLIHALDTAARSHSCAAVLYLDLDRFKPVNDLLGHAGGDALLVQVAKRLRAELRATDTLARVGGDEFVVVLAGMGEPGKVAMLADRLIEAMTRPFDLDGRPVEIGTSIGIALYPADGESQDALMHAADTALYRAKMDQRGTRRFFEPTMDEHLKERRHLEQDLRHAVDRGELVLHYQPLVSCRTGEVEGFEALVRWQHPQRGLVPPASFIPLAEETGQIVRIGEWVLRTACATAVQWDKPYWVSVNFSPAQFRQLDLAGAVAGVLADTGLPATRLEIEITEGVLMEDVGRAVQVLSALRAMGARVALDDFGTGYSSLSYLRSFVFDKLKIDRSFIAELGQSEDAAMIVRTIIGLAHNLNLSIVAEGVETPQQLAMVREQLCDQVQGYLIGRPIEMEGPVALTAARSKRLLLEAANVIAHEDREFG